MLADQPTTGSSSRARPRARSRASGTGRPEAVEERPTRSSTEASGGAGVVTLADSTGPPEPVRRPAMIGA